MKKNTLLILTIVAMMSALVMSCKKSTPAPTAEIFFTVGTDGYTVTFNPTVTDVDTYAWDFGDKETSTEASPTHTYAKSGEYHVVLVVKGGGGEATAPKTVSIAASFLEMLTGGPTAAAGKTWVLSRIVTPGPTGDGGGPITPAMTIDQPAIDNILDHVEVDLGAEYDNEFTFFANGNYTMNLKNGNALAGAVYGNVMGTMQGLPAYSIGMCASTFPLPTSATWTKHTDNLVIDAITDPNTTDIPPIHTDVTFTGKTWISLSDGAYFGILDFPTTAKFIIKEITTTKMQVACFLCGYGYGDNVDDMMLPTNLIQITFIPKTTK